MQGRRKSETKLRRKGDERPNFRLFCRLCISLARDGKIHGLIQCPDKLSLRQVKILGLGQGN